MAMDAFTEGAIILVFGCIAVSMFLALVICILGDAGRAARKKRGEKLRDNPFIRPPMR